MSDYLERKFGDLTVRIDTDACMGNESCIAVAPEIFELDDDRISRFRDASGGVDRQRIIEACQVCPVDALIVLDAEGREIVP